MGRASPTPGLAYALRDKVAFEKLADPELEAMCRFWKEIQKLAAKSPLAPAGAGDDGKPETASPPTQAAVEPTEVVPPPKDGPPNVTKKVQKGG